MSKIKRARIAWKTLVSRLSGLSAFGFSVSWKASEPERHVVRSVIKVLEDKRVLYVDYESEVRLPFSKFSLDYRRNDARIVENGFAASSGVSKFAKIVLIQMNRSASVPTSTVPATWLSGSSTRSSNVVGSQRATTSLRPTTLPSSSSRQYGSGCALMSPHHSPSHHGLAAYETWHQGEHKLSAWLRDFAPKVQASF
jgi:hypothetical protein